MALKDLTRAADRVRPIYDWTNGVDGCCSTRGKGISPNIPWLKTIEVFNKHGEAQQLKLFPSHVAAPADDSQVARVLLNKVRLERTRQFGACYISDKRHARPSG
jgi:hypothetical protein